MGRSRPLFLYFCLFCILIVKLVDKILPMTGFELRISGVGSDRSTTTTTHKTNAISLFKRAGKMVVRGGKSNTHSALDSHDSKFK